MVSRAIRTGLVATIIAALWFGSSGSASAECGRGKVPTYSEISAVRFVRTGCFGKCPSYEVLIWPVTRLTYVGRKYVSKTGTYEAPIGNMLQRTIVVLSTHHFYELNYDDSKLITDVPHYVVAVVRCGVTTTLDWPDFGDRPDITSLFDALDAIVKGVKWHKASDETNSPDELMAPIIYVH